MHQFPLSPLLSVLPSMIEQHGCEGLTLCNIKGDQTGFQLLRIRSSNNREHPSSCSCEK